MKGGLFIICKSLLTIFLVSSCALFLLVVSEVLHAEEVVNENVDASGLHNVTQKVVKDDKILHKINHEEKDKLPDENNKIMENSEMIIPKTLSLNSVTIEGLPDTGQPPILMSLAENAKLDLKDNEELLFSNESNRDNETKIVNLVESSESSVKKEEQETLVVKAKPMHEARQEEIIQAAQQKIDIVEEVVTTESPIEPATIDTTEDIPAVPETPQEDIPSFSEWAQKQLAEAEKKDSVLNHSTQPSHSNTNYNNKNTKMRSKNYASPACGAKIVAVNQEAGSASSILSPNRDEYMLNTCNSRIWFVVELCEPVQAQNIELANFELFSSTPKDIAVYLSDRFPTREWASVGQFAAEDMRDVQSFDLHPHLFGKFIKVELLSHHGSEHYCPVSLFKVYGTSEFEVLEKENSQHASHIDEDDVDDIVDVAVNLEKEASKNLFGSARDAVMSIMKKAAQVLVKTEVPKNASSASNDTSTDNTYKKCCSPSHIIVCDNCSETLYNEVYEMISCNSDKLASLISQVFLRDTLKCTGICRPFGLDFKSTNEIEFSVERVAYLDALFPTKYLAALCNILAIQEKKVVLNTSFENDFNVSDVLSAENTSNNIETTTVVEDSTTIPSTEVLMDDNKTEVPLDINANVESIDKTMENTVLATEKDPQQLETDTKEPDSVTENAVLEKTDNLDADPESDNKSMELQIDENFKEVTKDPKVIKLDTEKRKEVNSGDETEPNLMESEGFMSDFDQLNSDPTPTQAPKENQAQSSQKESVFLRLSNRVKTLERNMSLSAQYLEELSRRYKKQVEDMQKTFEKTIVQMSEERRRSNEREQKYLEQLSNMQEQLTQVTIAMSILMEERESWFGNITFFKFLVFQIIVFAIAYFYFKRNRPVEIPNTQLSKKASKKKDKLRRKSVEGVSGHATPIAKKRRPSEEALQIARQCAEEVEADDKEWQVARKNRRRKTSILHRNVENERPAWDRQDSIGQLQENPIILDEEEFLAPVCEPTQFDILNTSVSPPRKEFPKTNGSIFNNLKNIKTRRLSSPAFLRTFSRQSSRSAPSAVLKSSDLNINGDFKAASESPTSSLWSQSTELSQINGLDNDVVRTKKKKGLKNIFKKVF